MANKHAALKAIRVGSRRRARNRIVRTATRTKVKQAAALIPEGDAAASESSVRDAIRSLDKAASKGIIKKNNASRRKGRLMKKLNQAKTSTSK